MRKKQQTNDYFPTKKNGDSDCFISLFVVLHPLLQLKYSLCLFQYGDQFFAS